MERELSFQQKLWFRAKAWKGAAVPLLLYILMPALSLTMGYMILHPDMSAQEFFTYGGNFYTAVGMMLTIYFLYRRSRKRGHLFFEDASLYLDGISWKKTAGFFFFGLSAALCISAFLSLLPRWGITNAYSQASQNMFRGQDILFTLITTVITGPLAEEVVFRGYMLGSLLERFSEKSAIWMVSIVFALCHGEFLWFFYALAMGLLLAWLSIKEDNIFYGIAMHVGFNAFSGITWLIRSVPAAEKLFYESKIIILGYALVGGMACALLGRRYRTGGMAWREKR